MHKIIWVMGRNYDIAECKNNFQNSVISIERSEFTVRTEIGVTCNVGPIFLLQILHIHKAVLNNNEHNQQYNMRLFEIIICYLLDNK